MDFIMLGCVHVGIYSHEQSGLHARASTADESAPLTCAHRPAFPTKCFNGHLVELISLGEMMAV